MEPIALQPDQICEIVSDSSCGGLIDCLKQLHRGPWRFLQLRGAPISDDAIDNHDLDLLGSRESVNLLLDAARDWMRAGKCHLKVTAARSDKVELTLFSLDGEHQVRFDLWIRLNQIDRGRKQLCYDDCAAHLVDPASAIARLPVDLEACLYLHHLVCKSKDLSSRRVQNRLKNYSNACRAIGMQNLSAVLDQIRMEQGVSLSAEQMALSRLTSTLCPKACPSSALAAMKRFWRWRLSAPRKPRIVSLMGCDGAGKTTLAETLSEQSPQSYRTFTGKHLYRKSLSYKLAVIFLRPLLTRSRERFDEILAPWLYLRACLSLWWKLLLPHRKTVLVDRSLVDFLYVDRKTDQPSFSRGRWLVGLIGKRIPTIHCHVAFETVCQRKQEMTAAGHAAYDRDMFAHFSRRVPTNYVAFNNDGPLTEAVSALDKILRSISGASDRRRTRGDRSDERESLPFGSGKETQDGAVSKAVA
jgi:hypothetical protein